MELVKKKYREIIEDVERMYLAEEKKDYFQHIRKAIRQAFNIEITFDVTVVDILIEKLVKSYERHSLNDSFLLVLGFVKKISNVFKENLFINERAYKKITDKIASF